MQGGDITNEVPKRVLVCLDVFVNRQPVVKKLLGILPRLEQEVSYNRQTIQRLWRFSDRTGKILELVAFEIKEKELQQVMDDLDNLGTNPFNYSKVFESVADLVSELPYRPEVTGVIDISPRALRYGSWFFDLERI